MKVKGKSPTLKLTDYVAEDVGDIVSLEHVNIEVPDQSLALLTAALGPTIPTLGLVAAPLPIIHRFSPTPATTTGISSYHRRRLIICAASARVG